MYLAASSKFIRELNKVLKDYTENNKKVIVTSLDDLNITLDDLAEAASSYYHKHTDKFKEYKLNTDFGELTFNII